jgi:tRNA G18 (ribose-2'-O)-methylase SpoU
MIRECTNPDCRLRFPICNPAEDTIYCPSCGESAHIVEDIPIVYNLRENKEKANWHNIVLILDNIRSAYNVGSIIRTSDALGVQEIYFCGITPTRANPKINKTSLGAENPLNTYVFKNGLDAISTAKSQDYQIIALDTSHDAIPLDRFHPRGRKNIALVLGNEKAGIDPGILPICDHLVEIPMSGQKESLNVSVACGIALFYFHNLFFINSR